MKTAKTDYFKVIASEHSDSADILLYGIIGQDFYWDKELDEESITDLSFAKKIKELEAKYDRINIRINSPGGSMFHGNAIITAMQTCKAEIHTYNDGLAASMAADIWTAGKVRHMAKNALLMIHAPSSAVIGTAKAMREEADVLDKFEFTAIAVMVEATGMTEEEVKEKFYDYEDHWLTAPEVAELGLISQPEEYDAENVIEGVEKMKLSEIVQHFSEKGDKESVSIIENLRKRFSAALSKRTSFAKHSPNHIQIDKDMQIEDLKKSISEGVLAIDDIVQYLKENNYEVTETEPVVEQEVNIAEVVKQAIEAGVKPLNDEIAVLKAQVVELGGKPAATPTKAHSEGDPIGEPVVDEFDQSLKELAELAKEHKRLIRR